MKLFDKDSYKVLLIRLGLALISAVYVVLGAGAFLLIERPHELQEKERTIALIKVVKAKFDRKSWELFENMDLNKSEVFRRFEILLDEYTNTVFKSLSLDFGITFMHSYLSLKRNNLQLTAENLEKYYKPEWTYRSSLLLCITIMTTVGYGYITPRTVFGRMFCVLYGMIGIPLAIVSITEFAKTLAEKLTVLYQDSIKLVSFLSSKFCRRSREPNEEDSTNIEEKTFPLLLVIFIMVSYPFVGAAGLGRLANDWQWINAIYFGLVSMFTIGYGDMVINTDDTFHLTGLIIYLLIGIVIVTMGVDLVAADIMNSIHFFGREVAFAKQFGKKFGGMLKGYKDSKMDKFRNYSVEKKLQQQIKNKCKEQEKMLLEKMNQIKLCKPPSPAAAFGIDEIDFIDTEKESVSSIYLL